MNQELALIMGVTTLALFIAIVVISLSIIKGLNTFMNDIDILGGLPETNNKARERHALCKAEKPDFVEILGLICLAVPAATIIFISQLFGAVINTVKNLGALRRKLSEYRRLRRTGLHLRASFWCAWNLKK